MHRSGPDIAFFSAQRNGHNPLFAWEKYEGQIVKNLPLTTYPLSKEGLFTRLGFSKQNIGYCRGQIFLTLVHYKHRWLV